MPFHEAVLPVTARAFEPPCFMSPDIRSSTESPLDVHDVPLPSKSSETPVPVPVGLSPVMFDAGGVTGVSLPPVFPPSSLPPIMSSFFFTLAEPLDL